MHDHKCSVCESVELRLPQLAMAMVFFIRNFMKYGCFVFHLHNIDFMIFFFFFESSWYFSKTLQNSGEVKSD